MTPLTTDFLVVGGGVVGLTIALELRRRYPDSSVTVVEKDARWGMHASTRNSGVLHAGFYYGADTLKARLTVEGNRRLTEYCLERGLAVNQCGKLVVAKDESELPGLDELARRGQTNGVRLEPIDEAEVRALEPNARTFERALFSPTTSSVDPRQVVDAYVADARDRSIRLLGGNGYRGRNGSDVILDDGVVAAGYVVNAAGLYADRIARDFGFGERYAVLPFKGLYLYQDPGPQLVRTHIYPVPDLNYPWLGVHLTVTVRGEVKIGPTATPAFWREHYRGVQNFRLAECVEILWREAGLFLKNEFDFRRVAFRELQKYSRSRLVQMSTDLAKGVSRRQFRRWGPAGIRAQLVNVVERRLEMDFQLEGDDRSFHVLNAVSPAFTCALSFAEYAVDQIAASAA